MKTKLAILVGMLFLTLTAYGIAVAGTYSFNFENIPGGDVDSYMTNVFGSNVDASGVVWYNDSALFHSDVLYVNSGGSGTINFNPSNVLGSSYKITSLSFTWGVYNDTSGIDFGLDVYDKTLNGGFGGWRLNVFSVNGVDYDTGDSGVQTFNSTWAVTQIRFHDSGLYDVGLDNLVLNDNRCAVPEPSTMLLIGSGLLGMGVFRKRFKKS